MYSWDTITSETAKISIESHGEAVFTDVNETILVGDNQARWFWELLQNAKDAIDDDQTVNVRLVITDDEVVFKHDGNTFELAEILKLITQGSSKKGKEGKTGRFGTGFISTYILSRQVRIQGMLDDQTPFNFLLDREADTAPAFLIKQQVSTKDFYASFGKDNRESLNGFTTSFTYRLSDTGKIASTSGLEEIAEYLPYVLAFNPKFKNISVLVNGLEMSYEREEPVKYTGYEHPLEEIGIHSMIGETPGLQSVVKVIGENWESGFKIVEDETGKKFTPMNTQTPNLFASFPLLGTEVLGLPFAVNSTEFGIKHERNGVFLGSGINDVITKNKNTVKEAIAALTSVLAWSLKQAVGHQFNIITFYNRDVPKWLDGPWMTDLKKEAIAAVTAIPLVTTHQSEGKPIAIADLLIPGEDDASTRGAMFKLLTDFAPKSIPIEEEAEQWYEFAVNAEDFPDENQEVQKKRFLMTDFCGLVQAQINLATLQTTLGSITAIDWLNELYVLAGKQDISLFHKYGLVPVRSRDLVKIDATIKTDKIMDDTLYAVSDLLGNKLFPTLVEPGIDLPSGLCGAYLKEDLVNKLIGENANQPVTAFVKPELIEANALMLKWLITNKRDGLINAYQVITAGEDQSKNIVFNKMSLGTFADKKQKLLAPKSAWRSAFKLFEKLVRDRDCLHEIYAAVFDEGDFNSLADSAFIHLTPLIKGVMQLTKTVAPQMLKDMEQESLLINEDGSSKMLEVPYSDFAFFARSDNQIFSNNTTTQSSIEILQFVLQEGVAVDENYNQFSKLTLDTGQQLEVRKALWVGRLKNNQWVNVKNTSGETNQSYSGERPSSQNLSGLINSAPYLKTLIKDEKATALLNLLGVSVSDLLKNTLGTEAEKVAWERAFTALLSANLDPELAEVMLKDKNLQQEYRKRQQNTLIINRNQEIGGLLEAEFKKLFLRPEFSHLDIERKPFGSDFIISPESSDLVDENGNKIIFRIGSWFLELKATGREYAAMTKLQAQRAVENSTHYALVVLPLNNFQINGDNILHHVRFVKNIGEILTKKYQEVTSLKTQQDLVILPTDEVQVAIDEEDIRYNIQASVWLNGIKMMDFINDLNDAVPVNGVDNG